MLVTFVLESVRHIKRVCNISYKYCSKEITYLFYLLLKVELFELI